MESECPALGIEDMAEQLQDLENALIDLNGLAVPPLEIGCRSTDIAKTLVQLLLERRVFLHLFGRLKNVTLVLTDPEITPQYMSPRHSDILFAPTEFVVDGETVALDGVQRAEWVLLKDDRRKTYLQELLQASQAAAVTPVMNSRCQPSASASSQGVLTSQVREVGEGAV